jgi:hypothetical protein
MPRAAKRTLPVLVKWFSDNWATVEPMLGCVHLADENGRVINFGRELGGRCDF